MLRLSAKRALARAAALLLGALATLATASGQAVLDAPFASSASARLGVRAEVAAEGVRLQWLPTDQADFAEQLARGFRLERFGESPTGDLLGAPDFARALSLQGAVQWAAAGDEDELYDDLAALAAGAGGSAADAEEEAFGTSLTILELDLDYAAARRAGFGYVDADAERGRRYTYVIADGRDGRTLATLRVATDTLTAYAPPRPLAARRENLHGEVTWDRASTGDAYDAYRVERATLGTGDFRALGLPLVQLLSEGMGDTTQAYVDTTAHRDSSYVYRVTGVTCFGHGGPPSDTLVLRAAPAPLVPAPRITYLARVVDTLFRVEWALPAGADDAPADYGAVAGWRVYTSRESRVGLGVSAELPAETRELQVVNPADGTYFTVEAVDVNGQAVRSLPKILRAVDRRPPAPPTGLTGVIDTAGVVRLAWTPNAEEDLLGYRVFVSHRDTGYFAQLTPDAVQAVAYVDTVNMRFLNREVYYKLTAEDCVGNVSAYSEVAVALKPDLYPPEPPVIADFSASPEAVDLRIAPSVSGDVTAEVVQRRRSRSADTTWSLLADLPGADADGWVRLRDTTAVPGLEYEYRVVAVDASDLRSASLALVAGRTPTMLRAPVEGFAAAVLPGTARPTLSWGYPRPAPGPLRGFQVLRADVTEAPDAEPRAYRLLAGAGADLRLRGGRFYFSDAGALPGRRYAYRLYARYHDGGFSEKTEAIAVGVP